jgi:hypothetical protein
MKGVNSGSGLLADIGVCRAACFSEAAVDEYALIHEEKAILRFLCAFTIGKTRLIFNSPLDVRRDEFLKTLKTVASPMCRSLPGNIPGARPGHDENYFSSEAGFLK